MKKYVVIFEKTATGYTAFVPDLLGCVASGETKKQALKNIHEAIEFHIEGLLLDGANVPDGQTEAETLEFSVV